VRPANDDVFHQGEIAVQELAGSRDMALRVGRGISPAIVPGARTFLANQRLLALATAAPRGESWASVWFGAPGIAESRDDGHRLWLARERAAPLDVDPVVDRLQEGSWLGVLAIDLETRKRLRVNGIVRELGSRAIVVDVKESFPNCPRYIAKRNLSVASGDPQPSQQSCGVPLDAPRRRTIARTDTVFVASWHPERGADASHRGGHPGFVRVIDDHSLRIPDYAGNGMYQTFGNLQVTGRAGLVFLDFEDKRVLHVSGVASLRFDQPEQELVTGGTGRSLELRIEHWVEGSLPTTVDVGMPEPSPFNPEQ
jgi:predicted pyridoxine 5'-phosphate oxidase superfamily flavin-nucleotide-binding protein